MIITVSRARLRDGHSAIRLKGAITAKQLDGVDYATHVWITQPCTITQENGHVAICVPDEGVTWGTRPQL